MLRQIVQLSRNHGAAGACVDEQVVTLPYRTISADSALILLLCETKLLHIGGGKVHVVILDNPPDMYSSKDGIYT